MSDFWNRIPYIETLIASLLFLFLLGVLVAGCGTADTGSRHPKTPYKSFTVRSITVIPPANATSIELRWIEETVTRHLLLLDAIPLATSIRFNLKVHRTRQYWQTAYLADPLRPIIWDPPLVRVGPQQNQVYLGPVEPAFLTAASGTATLHVISGVSFQGPSWGHHLAHIYIPDIGVPSHVYGEPLWTKLNEAGWRLSNTLAAQR